MDDYLIRGTACNDQVRVFAVRTTNLVEELRKRQDTWATASAALGRAVTAGAMMGAMLKGDDRLTIQINGGGPIGQIIVDANAKGEVRGYVRHPHVDFPLNEKGKLDVARAVGKNGYLHVIKDLGLKEPYRGSVPIVSGEIGEDFTYYFAYSEQVPSAVALGVLVNPDHSILAAGGFIVQLLPDVGEDVISKIEKQIGSLPPVSGLIAEGKAPEEIAGMAVGDQVNILSTMDIQFKCQCSFKKVEETLISLGADELKSLIDEGEAEVVCHFCNEKYHFEKEILKDLLKQIQGEK